MAEEYLENTAQVKLIRKNNSDEVTAYHDAAMWQTMMGDGILSNVYEEFGAEYSNSILKIKSGMLLFGGRLVEIPQGQEIQFDTSIMGSGTFYVQLHLSIKEDDSQSDVSIVVSQTKSSQTGDDVIKQNTGDFYYDLYELIPPVSLNLLAHKFVPGEAKNALNLIGGAGTTFNGVPFEEVFHIGTNGKIDGVNYAVQCDKAVETLGFKGGAKNEVSESLSFPNRNTDLCQILMLAEVTGETKSITLQVISSDLDRGEQANWPTIVELETNSNAKEALACTEENRSQRNIFKVVWTADEYKGWNLAVGRVDQTDGVSGLLDGQSFVVLQNNIAGFYNSLNNTFKLGNLTDNAITLTNFKIAVFFGGGPADA